ncbi:hypothetical protein V3851_07185 [Paenibacillus sp. M1]|uniref:Uncharacterized protein n=1 Tax=Paenibacillus haidiansis TaxID=1574488 RepID=A0ABU7VQY7_9BACL
MFDWRATLERLMNDLGMGWVNCVPHLRKQGALPLNTHKVCHSGKKHFS